MRCTSPDVYVNETMTITTNLAKVLKTVPASFKTITERVLVKEEEKIRTVIPAKWGTETVTYVSKGGGNSLKILPTSFSTSSETIEVKPGLCSVAIRSCYTRF